MTDDKMEHYIKLFDNKSEPIFCIWDERTSNKKILCASHDLLTVCEYIVTSPIVPEKLKFGARKLLAQVKS